MHQQLGRRHPLGEGVPRPRRPRPRRRRRHATRHRDRRARARRGPSQSPLASRSSGPRAVGARAPSRRSARGRGPAPASGFSAAVSSRAATAATAASSSAIWLANMSRNRPEIRQVTSTRGRPTTAGGSTSMPVTRAGGAVPLRPAAHQRQPLGDRFAAGPEAGAAPEVDDQRPRPVAMLLHEAAQHLVGGRPCRARRRSASAGSADRRCRGCARSAARRCGRAPARPAGPGATCRPSSAASSAARSAAAQACRAGVVARRCAAIDMQPVLDREVLEVAEPGVDPHQRRLGIVRRARRPPRRPARSRARSRRSAAPAGRAGAGRARRPGRIRRPAAPASRCASLRPAPVSGGVRWPSVTAAIRRLACAASPGLLTMNG